MKRVSIALLVGAMLLVGCDNPQRTVASLRKEIAEFKTAPNEKTRIKIEEDLAKLERQIAELQQRGDPKADELRNQLVSLRSEYQAAKISKAVQDTRNAIQGFGEALKETARSVEEAFKNADTEWRIIRTTEALGQVPTCRVVGALVSSAQRNLEAVGTTALQKFSNSSRQAKLYLARYAKRLCSSLMLMSARD